LEVKLIKKKKRKKKRTKKKKKKKKKQKRIKKEKKKKKNKVRITNNKKKINKIKMSDDPLHHVTSTMAAQVKMMLSVKEALDRLNFTEDTKNYILDRREMWATFGKMNSHLYRAILMKRMKDANLDGICQFIVFFLFGVIKNQGRVSRALDAMEPQDKALPWFGPVKAFVDTHVTQYVSDVVKSKKFPAVNIPTCNPGLDILVYALITHPNNRSIEEVTVRPTFSQLDLDGNMQAEAKEGYRYYWESVVKGSRNPDKTTLEVPQFREEYYANSLNDKYKLVDLELNEVPPTDANLGYTMEDVYAYFLSIDPRSEYDAENAKLEMEMNTIRNANTPAE
jgi:hypothetical protein